MCPAGAGKNRKNAFGPSLSRDIGRFVSEEVRARNVLRKQKSDMKSWITEPLGLFGWGTLEPVLLASLLSEDPLLLVGAHGSAKSFLLERLAESLGMVFRSYNASLLNYDDLVGVPMPDATRTKLEYLASAESIWDAEVVFIDEINRTRPELQNKLFPIVYDRRVQGRPLERLVYRWAAMNPPPEDDDPEALYLGAEPLDAALADRFPFIVAVPDWADLSPEEQRNVLADQFVGRHEFPVPIRALIDEARARYEALVPVLSSRLASYVLLLVPHLRAAKYDVSTRRATMLQRCALAVHAAREVLAERSADPPPTLRDSAYLALLCSLPDRARRTLSVPNLAAVFQKVWNLSEEKEAEAADALLKIADPVLRLRRMVSGGIALSPDRMAVVIGEGVARAKPHLRRGLALATYLAVRTRTDIPATTMELLAHEISPAVGVYGSTGVFLNPSRQRIFSVVGSLDAGMRERHGPDAELSRYHANLLNSYLPDGFPGEEAVAEASSDFETLWKEFGL